MRRLRLAALLGAPAACLLGSALPAPAATVAVVPSPFQIGAGHPRVLVYQAARGEENRVSTAGFVLRGARWVGVREALRTTRMRLGAGCQTGDPKRGQTGRTGVTVTGPAWAYCRLPATTPLNRPWVVLRLGDGTDAASTWNGPGESVIEAGPGSDIVQGGKISDTVCSATIRPGARVWPALDPRDCGGSDAPQDPRLMQNIINGGGGDDLLVGGDGVDGLDGEAGDDTIWAGGGADVLIGGAGNDALNGEAGDDYLDENLAPLLPHDRDGHDVLDGGFGDDTAGYRDAPFSISFEGGTATTPTGDDEMASVEEIWGSPLADSMHGSSGIDHFYAAGGNDIINVAGDPAAADGFQDVVDCGAGSDIMVGDSTWAFFGGGATPDAASACEDVQLTPAPPGA